MVVLASWMISSAGWLEGYSNTCQSGGYSNVLAPALQLSPNNELLNKASAEGERSEFKKYVINEDVPRTGRKKQGPLNKLTEQTAHVVVSICTVSQVRLDV